LHISPEKWLKKKELEEDWQPQDQFDRLSNEVNAAFLMFGEVIRCGRSIQIGVTNTKRRKLAVNE
jgi:hypothetical protein